MSCLVGLREKTKGHRPLDASSCSSNEYGLPPLKIYCVEPPCYFSESEFQFDWTDGLIFQQINSWIRMNRSKDFAKSVVKNHSNHLYIRWPKKITQRSRNQPFFPIRNPSFHSQGAIKFIAPKTNKVFRFSWGFLCPASPKKNYKKMPLKKLKNSKRCLKTKKTQFLPPKEPQKQKPFVDFWGPHCAVQTLFARNVKCNFHASGSIAPTAMASNWENSKTASGGKIHQKPDLSNENSPKLEDFK